MELLRLLRFYIVGIIICVIALTLEVGGILSIGKIVNYFFPCNQNPVYSAPCYIGFDIAYYLIIMSIIMVLAIVALTKTVKYLRSVKK